MMTLTDTVSDTTLIENLDDFKYISKSSFHSQSGMITAFFVPLVNGTYSFPVDCRDSTSSLHMIDLSHNNIYIKKYLFLFYNLHIPLFFMWTNVLYFTALDIYT